MPPKANEFVIWRTNRNTVFLHDGKEVTPPDSWCFVPAGDPGLTRRIKAKADYWLLVHKHRNRIEALGLWTESSHLEQLRRELEAERSDPAYQKKLDAGRRAREAKQIRYESDFKTEVIHFLNFAENYKEIAERLAEAVTAHAVPVGSGTVARTERIPIGQRAEAAVIAWMRHQTTAYDSMKIARIRGERREVRRQLAERSREILAKYRSGAEIDRFRCPLLLALNRKHPGNE